MKKMDRQLMFDKYGGRCAYCGCELSKVWCLDHIKPVLRKNKTVGGFWFHKVTGAQLTEFDLDRRDEFEWVERKSIPDGFHFPENDTVQNANPACHSCNHYKSTMDLEMFRENVGKLIGRLNKSFNQYKIAKRYGLVQETGNEVTFYFELFNNPNKPIL